MQLYLGLFLTFILDVFDPWRALYVDFVTYEEVVDLETLAYNAQTKNSRASRETDISSAKPGTTTRKGRSITAWRVYLYHEALLESTGNVLRAPNPYGGG